MVPCVPDDYAGAVLHRPQGLSELGACAVGPAAACAAAMAHQLGHLRAYLLDGFAANQLNQR